jgi:hypothetical protein
LGWGTTVGGGRGAIGAVGRVGISGVPEKEARRGQESKAEVRVVGRQHWREGIRGHL